MTASIYQSLAKRRILLAEDVELNQQLARHIMQGWGVEVDLASNGKEALGLVEQNGYDLVLMDIHMPEMDGMEATRRIRRINDHAKSTVPIVALTANALKGDRERFLEAGMNDYLSKPFNEADLFRIISKNLISMPPTDIQHQTDLVVAEAVEVTQEVKQDKLYNLKMVQELAGGDESFVMRMLQLFLDTMPLTLQEMQQETGLQHWTQVGKLAHKLKSTIDSMGIVTLKEVIREVEQEGKKGEHVDLIPKQVQQVTEVMLACAAQVKKDYGL